MLTGKWHKKLRPVSNVNFFRYTYAAVFATQNLAAATYTEHWTHSEALEGIDYFSVAPVVICLINFFGVFVGHLLCFESTRLLTSIVLWHP